MAGEGAPPAVEGSAQDRRTVCGEHESERHGDHVRVEGRRGGTMEEKVCTKAVASANVSPSFETCEEPQ